MTLSFKKTKKIEIEKPKSNSYQLVFYKRLEKSEIDWPGTIFEKPYQITENEMYKLLSFLFDQVETKTDDKDPFNIFLKVEKILEEIIFFNDENYNTTDANKIYINENHKNSIWYIKDVTQTEIANICKGMNQQFEIPETYIIEPKKILKKQNNMI